MSFEMKRLRNKCENNLTALMDSTSNDH